MVRSLGATLSTTVAPAAMLLFASAPHAAASAAPKVEFMGNSPQFKIYPSGVEGSDAPWVQISLGAIAEVDSAGTQVTNRVFQSLAAIQDAVKTVEVGVVGGANATITTVAVPLAWSSLFLSACDVESVVEEGVVEEGSLNAVKSSGSGEATVAPGNITIQTMVFAEDAEIQYGDGVIDISPNQMKFNIESASWPFCATSNKLSIAVELQVKGGGAPTAPKMEQQDAVVGVEASVSVSAGVGEAAVSGSSDAAVSGSGEAEVVAEAIAEVIAEGDGGSDGMVASEGKVALKGPARRLSARKPKGKKLSAGASADFQIELDFPTSVLVDGQLDDCEVNMTTGAKLELSFIFPAFNEKLLYDPTGSFVAAGTLEAEDSQADEGNGSSDGSSNGTDDNAVTGLMDAAHEVALLAPASIVALALALSA
mmetsp:Transcript_106513/g.306223  ORF Transcript_106513/g.306223 Transcript_106513/m.306223 type:complete len:424 (-) Transcript_106513:66-1337(-)